MDEEQDILRKEITPENIGQLLEVIRQKAGMKWGELAEDLGIQESTIFRLKSKDKPQKADSKVNPTMKASIELWRRLHALGRLRPKGVTSQTDTDKLTVGDVVAGLATMAKVKVLGTPAWMGGVAGGLLGYGILQALKKLFNEQVYEYKEAGEHFEISKKQGGATEGNAVKPEQTEKTDATDRSENLDD